MLAAYHRTPSEAEWKLIKSRLFKIPDIDLELLDAIDSKTCLLDVAPLGKQYSRKGSLKLTTFRRHLREFQPHGIPDSNWKFGGAEHRLCIVRLKELAGTFTNVDPQVIADAKDTEYAVVWIIGKSARKRPTYSADEIKKALESLNSSDDPARQPVAHILGKKDKALFRYLKADSELDIVFEKLECEFGPNKCLSFDTKSFPSHHPGDFFVYFVDPDYPDICIRDLVFLKGMGVDTLALSSDGIPMDSHLEIKVLPQGGEDFNAFALNKIREFQDVILNSTGPKKAAIRVSNSITSQIQDLAAEKTVRFRQLQSQLKPIMKQVSNRNLQIRIAAENTFLPWAESFLDKAKMAFITSSDKVSNFWINEDYEKQVEDYLQRNNTTATSRLFAFSSAKQLAAYRATLSEHYSHYGRKVKGARKCGVFVTSLDSFRKIIQSYAPEIDHLYDNEPCDFGIVEADDNNRYLLVLSKKTLSCEWINIERLTDFVQFFEDKVHSIPEAKSKKLDHDISIACWGERYLEDDDFEELVEVLFGKKKHDLLHTVTISRHPYDDEAAIRVALQELENSIREHKDYFARTYQLKHIAFGQFLPRESGDAPNMTEIEGGPSISYPRPDDCYYFHAARFPSEEALNKYLKDPVHLKIRRDFYMAIDKKIKEFYDSFNAKDVEDGKWDEWADRMMQNRMKRRDFLLDNVD